MLFIKIVLFVCFIFTSSIEFVFANSIKTIVVLGDSLADGYGVEKSEAYPALLELLLKEKGKNVRVLNAGLSGSTSASGLKRLKWQLKNPMDILILELGGNDGLRGIDLKSTSENLKNVIVEAKKNKITVLLAGMQIPKNYGDTYSGEFKKVFFDLSKSLNVTLIPFLLEGVGGVEKYNQADGIHPNQFGHKKIAETILPYLEKLL